MFALALGDPVEYRQGLERLVTPGSLDRWCDFVRAAADLQRLAPWHVRGFTAFDAVEPDVAFVGLQAARPASLDGRRLPGGTAIVTVVRPLGWSGRWFVRQFRGAAVQGGIEGLRVAGWAIATSRKGSTP